MKDCHVTAVLNVYDEYESSKKCIDSFLKFYPNSPIIICGSKRDVVSKLATEYKSTFNITQQYIGPLHRIEEELFDVPRSQIIRCIETQIENLYHTFLRVETEFLFFLHPDHRVKGKLNFNYAKMDMEISNTNLIEKRLKFLIEQKLGVRIGAKYGIWGYFKKNSIVSSLTYVIDNREFLSDLLELSNLFIYDDFLLPVVMNLLGYKVGNEYVTEELRRRNSIRRKFQSKLVHHVGV